MSTGNENGHVVVRAKRPFDGDEGFKCPNSKPFEVSRRRFAELKANDLVEKHDDAAVGKQALAPENKMAEAPANKVRSEPARGQKS